MSGALPLTVMTSLSLGEDFRKSLIDAAQFVLKAQANIELKVAEIKIYDPAIFKDPLAIAATIGVIGDKVMGGVALAFSKETFLGISNQMLGEACTEITPENQDLAGELLNIIFGKVKSDFKDAKKIPMSPAIPIVMRSSDLKFSFDTKEATYVICFSTPLGPLFAATSITLIKS